MPFSSRFSISRVILILCICYSCKPAIYSFNVSPLVITGDQKVHIDLDVKGKASMEFNEHLSSDSVHLLEYTLIVTKAGKEVRKTVQVQKLKELTSINIAFATSSIEGDFILASGENNSNQWGNFQIISLNTAMSRDVTAVHTGRTVLLKGDGSPSSEMAGVSAGGEWSLKARLTAEEKADSSKIPQELRVKAVIKPLNP